VAIGALSSYLIAIRVIAITACVSPVVTAGYLLWAFQRIYLGLEHPREQAKRDVDGQEMTVLICMTAMAILLGILPAFFVFALSNLTVAGIMKLF
jgi:NADH-quinone oxidoreductase subunit M